jgi:hypothetical protein
VKNKCNYPGENYDNLKITIFNLNNEIVYSKCKIQHLCHYQQNFTWMKPKKDSIKNIKMRKNSLPASEQDVIHCLRSFKKE